jgi:hypothetical protein
MNLHGAAYWIIVAAAIILSVFVAREYKSGRFNEVVLMAFFGVGMLFVCYSLGAFGYYKDLFGISFLEALFWRKKQPAATTPTTGGGNKKSRSRKH